METWESWEALPFHFIYIGVGVVYGLRMWRVRAAVLAITLVALSTGALTLIAVNRGTEGAAELAEVPLMSLIYLTMVLHVNSRQRAARLVEQLLDHERRLHAYATHELMTPLTVARGEIELLDRKRVARPDDVARTHRVVLDELRRSEKLVSDLLLAARITVGTPTLELVNAEDIVLDAAERWDARTPAGVVVDAVACGTIHVARDDLMRALDNLLTNAARHSDAEDVIHISSHGRGGALELRVEDTGRGIDPSDLPHVFDRFYRSSESRQSAWPGAGLGLAIVRDIVEGHGGSVTIASRVGDGTVVTIVLPGFEDESAAPASGGSRLRRPALARRHSLR
jgi:signal transduction histidine kinase